MKNYLFVLALFIWVFTSCTKCSTEKIEAVQVTALMNVEHIVSTDKQYMFNNYGGEYSWFETCIVLEDYLDSENCNGNITSVANVFLIVNMSKTEGDVFVILAAHTNDTIAYEVKHGFWVEDFEMNNDSISLTFKEAFEKTQQVNYPKPHSRQVVLRKPIGPISCNPQYIFGNIESQIWVDAITGDVKNSNPAFPDEIN